MCSLRRLQEPEPINWPTKLGFAHESRPNRPSNPHAPCQDNSELKLFSSQCDSYRLRPSVEHLYEGREIRGCTGRLFSADARVLQSSFSCRFHRSLRSAADLDDSE